MRRRAGDGAAGVTPGCATCWPQHQASSCISAETHDRAGVRSHPSQQKCHPVPAKSQVRGPHGVAISNGHPQPHQAPPPPDRHRRGLNGPGDGDSGRSGPVRHQRRYQHRLRHRSSRPLSDSLRGKQEPTLGGRSAPASSPQQPPGRRSATASEQQSTSAPGLPLTWLPVRGCGSLVDRVRDRGGLSGRGDCVRGRGAESGSGRATIRRAASGRSW